MSLRFCPPQISHGLLWD